MKNWTDTNGIKIFHGDVIDGLREMDEQSVNCCVTSPPYWGLRDYGVDGQIGVEETPEEFIERMVEVFREVKRVLRDDGTLWLNIGDSYCAANSGNNGFNDGRKNRSERKSAGLVEGLKPKDLVGIPWMLAFALRADGWYLRQDIIWSKPNPMPESVTDRCTKSHEHIFLLSKSRQYYYDHEAIKEDCADSSVSRYNQNIENQQGSDRVPGKTNGMMKAVGGPKKSGNKKRKSGSDRGCPESTGSNVCGSVPWEGYTRNKRDVWTVSTKPFKEAHFATFNPELITPCVLAGSPEGGVVLDPFMGAGTTAVTAHDIGRKAIGCELNGEYLYDICIPRIKQETKQQRLIA